MPLYSEIYESIAEVEAIKKLLPKDSPLIENLHNVMWAANLMKTAHPFHVGQKVFIAKAQKIDEDVFGISPSKGDHFDLKKGTIGKVSDIGWDFNCFPYVLFEPERRNDEGRLTFIIPASELDFYRYKR